MTNAPDYILVLEQQPSHDPQGLALLQMVWRSPLVVAHSTAQVLDSIRDIPPCLVILIGNHTRWPSQFSRQLRTEANSLGCTILALTDAAAPSWPDQSDTSIFDGFLVKPLTSDVLTSVLQTAQARRSVTEQPSVDRIAAQSGVQSTGKSTI
ncbi:MAG: hypothetical protein F6K09_23675 [Merismopedia sp. SIO2A8]|nr:hypothetical protein [Merismopedia sp. SIO2A8]